MSNLLIRNMKNTALDSSSFNLVLYIRMDTNGTAFSDTVFVSHWGRYEMTRYFVQLTVISEGIEYGSECHMCNLVEKFKY